MLDRKSIPIGRPLTIKKAFTKKIPGIATLVCGRGDISRRGLRGMKWEYRGVKWGATWYIGGSTVESGGTVVKGAPPRKTGDTMVV